MAVYGFNESKDKVSMVEKEKLGNMLMDLRSIAVSSYQALTETKEKYPDAFSQIWLDGVSDTIADLNKLMNEAFGYYL